MIRASAPHDIELRQPQTLAQCSAQISGRKDSGGDIFRHACAAQRLQRRRAHG